MLGLSLALHWEQKGRNVQLKIDKLLADWMLKVCLSLARPLGLAVLQPGQAGRQAINKK